MRRNHRAVDDAADNQKQNAPAELLHLTSVFRRSVDFGLPRLTQIGASLENCETKRPRGTHSL